MSTRARPTPLEAFEANMADAHHLVRLAEGMTNRRAQRMRRELRDRIGSALRIRVADRAELDCLHSADVFVTFLPGSRLCREDFLDQRPLLRQAIVAGCAATETYLADKVMTRIGQLLKSSESASPRMNKLPMDIKEWLYIEQHYQRRRVGLRERVVAPYVREQASTSPTKVGEMLALIGVEHWSRQVDQQRSVAKGATVAFLEEVTVRRNRIAHQGDRQGFGRAHLSVDEARDDLAGLVSVVEALEAIVV
jgi:hypothetical protein